MAAAAGSYEVIAHNYALESENKIHSDDVAARYGFKGGLVPGVADMAYLARAVHDAWGDPWLTGGTLEVKLFKPVYHGERAQARATPAGDGVLELALLNADGVTCAAGRAGLDDADAPPDPAAFAHRAPLAPDDRPTPERATFAPGTVLGAHEYRYDARAADASARQMFVDRWPGPPNVPVWHPALYLHDANMILRENVRLGPWIHTSSRLQLFGAPTQGELVSLRGTVTDTYEKRDHTWTEIDVGVFADDRPIARVRHSAIIHLAGT